MEIPWKLKDAKAKFSKIVDGALKLGPQRVTRRGKKAVVVLSVEENGKLASKKPSFKEFLFACPKMDDDFALERQKDVPRELEL